MSHKLPYMPFFVEAWLSDPDLKRCSHHAKGVWIDMICLMWNSPRRGFLESPTGEPWTIDEIATAVGGVLSESRAAVEELLLKGVARRSASQSIYCERLRRYEELRQKRSAAGRRGGFATAKLQQTVQQTSSKSLVSNVPSPVIDFPRITEEEILAREMAREQCAHEPAAVREVQRYFAAKGKSKTSIDSSRYVAAEAVIEDYDLRFLQEAVTWAITRQPIAGFRMMLAHARTLGGKAAANAAPGFKTARQSEDEQDREALRKLGL